MKNPLFGKKADAALISQFLIDQGWAEMPSHEGLSFTKDGVGTVVWDATGWTLFDSRGKEKDFGSNLGDFKQLLGVPLHSEEGFMRGKKFKTEKKPDVNWKETTQGENVPEFNEQDKKYLSDELRISSSLRRKVIAAYMNGYAEHAAKWLREKGYSYRGSDKYAETNGLRPEYFKEAIQTMSRYASYRSKIAAAAPRVPKSKSAAQDSLAVPLESASHVAFHLFNSGLPDFNAETDDDSRVTYFSFDSPQDLEVAHQLIYQAFKRQIDAGKGVWAEWREEEANPGAMHGDSTSKALMSSGDENRNDLDACNYCKDQEPKNKAQRKRLKDTRQNRAREQAIYKALTPKASSLLKKAKYGDDSPFSEINDPVCICKHKFLDHERNCDLCDCPGFDPATMKKQIEYVCEHRAFDRVGKKENPMVFERHDGEMVLKIWLEGDRVGKVEFHQPQENADRFTPSQPLVTKGNGWEKFFSITQTYGD